MLQDSINKFRAKNLTQPLLPKINNPLSPEFLDDVKAQGQAIAFVHGEYKKQQGRLTEIAVQKIDETAQEYYTKGIKDEYHRGSEPYAKPLMVFDKDRKMVAASEDMKSLNEVMAAKGLNTHEYRGFIHDHKDPEGKWMKSNGLSYKATHHPFMHDTENNTLLINTINLMGDQKKAVGGLELHVTKSDPYRLRDHKGQDKSVQELMDLARGKHLLNRPVPLNETPSHKEKQKAEAEVAKAQAAEEAMIAARKAENEVREAAERARLHKQYLSKLPPGSDIVDELVAVASAEIDAQKVMVPFDPQPTKSIKTEPRQHTPQKMPIDKKRDRDLKKSGSVSPPPNKGPMPDQQLTLTKKGSGNK